MQKVDFACLRTFMQNGRQMVCKKGSRLCKKHVSSAKSTRLHNAYKRSYHVHFFKSQLPPAEKLRVFAGFYHSDFFDS